MLNKITKDDIQQEVLKVAISTKRMTAALSMGVGKTYLGLQYINHFYNQHPIKVLIVIPKLSMIQTWKDEAEKFNMDGLLQCITFTTYLSLHKQHYDYDIIILDEVHNLLYQHDTYLAQCGQSRILGLTGTPPRHSSSEKGVMVNTYCPVKYTYVVNDAVDDKILNNYNIIVHMLKLDSEKTIRVTTKTMTFMTSEVANYTYATKRIEESSNMASKKMASIMRMKGMMEYKSKEEYAKKLLNQQTEKSIVFCNTQKQADDMCVNSYHSKNEDSELNLDNFKKGIINKMSCVLQLNEGINISGLKCGIILHAYGNERKTSQRLARLLRLNPNETSTVHILCYVNTVDEMWVQSALQDFDKTKIKYLNTYTNYDRLD